MLALTSTQERWSCWWTDSGALDVR
jgi:hypothetical protein